MNKLGKIFNVAFVVVFYMISVLVVGNMITGSYIASLLSVPVFVLIAFAMSKQYRWLDRINLKVTWAVIQVLSAILMVYMAFAMEVKLSWDWGGLIKNATNVVFHNQLLYEQDVARYPNNEFWLAFLVILFKIVRMFYASATIETFKTVSIVVSCVFVQLTIFFIHKTAKLVWNEKKAFVVGIITVCCLPLYLYAMFAYTDTSGMLLAILMLYFYIKYNKTDGRANIAYTILIGIVAGISYKIKVTIFILFMAMICELFLNLKDAKQIKKFVMFVVIAMVGVVAVVSASNKVISSQFEISEEVEDANEFPLTHWVMMALGETGGYCEEDVSYTKSFPTYEEKNKADIKEIKKRVREKGKAGLIEHICYTKLKRTWGDSCLAGDDYAGRFPVDENGIWQRVFTFHGSDHWIGLIYSWLYYIVLIVGILLSGIFAIRRTNEQQKMLVLRIALFGIILFLSIWECNSRYLVAFIPVLIMTSADGIFMTREKIKNKKLRKQ